MLQRRLLVLVSIWKSVTLSAQACLKIIEHNLCFYMGSSTANLYLGITSCQGCSVRW